MTTVRSKAPGTLGKRVLYRTIDTTTLTGLRLESVTIIGVGLLASAAANPAARALAYSAENSAILETLLMASTSLHLVRRMQRRKSSNYSSVMILITIL